ncbi:MAG: hypothetical protein VW840_17595, partial [Gammaproteobacteria bacterium]
SSSGTLLSMRAVAQVTTTANLFIRGKPPKTSRAAVKAALSFPGNDFFGERSSKNVCCVTVLGSKQ